MNLQERIEQYLNKKFDESVTFESSKKDYEAVINSIKSLKGQFFGVMKNVTAEQLTGLTSELKSALAEIEKQVVKK